MPVERVLACMGAFPDAVPPALDVTGVLGVPEGLTHSLCTLTVKKDGNCKGVSVWVQSTGIIVQHAVMSSRHAAHTTGVVLRFCTAQCHRCRHLAGMVCNATLMHCQVAARAASRINTILPKRVWSRLSS